MILSASGFRLNLPHLSNGGHDISVSATAADVARHSVLDILVGGSDGLFEQSRAAHDLAAGAVAALIAVVLDERGLHRVKIVGLTEALDSSDPVVLVHDGKREATVDAASVHMDGAGPALAVVAALLCAGQHQALAQRVEQRSTRIEIAQSVILAIDIESEGYGSAGLFLRWLS
jgi:hypothetical protein